MKKILLASLVILFLSSCLKESIADAMLDEERTAAGTATMSYAVNGNPVTVSVNNPDEQVLSNLTLGCTKTDYLGTGYPVYILQCVGETGDFGFQFGVDLKVGNYAYQGNSGELFILDYYNTAEFVVNPLDSISFNITSYNKGHISGNFSGRLTPLVDGSGQHNIFGPPGSVLITNGSFKNVPVFN